MAKLITGRRGLRGLGGVAGAGVVTAGGDCLEHRGSPTDPLARALLILASVASGRTVSKKAKSRIWSRPWQPWRSVDSTLAIVAAPSTPAALVSRENTGLALARPLLFRRAMERLLQRYLWTIDAAAGLLGATLLGLAASTVVATRLTEGPPPPRVAPRLAVAETHEAVFDKRPDAILARNVFCSGCVPLVSDTTGAEGLPTEQQSALPAILVAVMYAPPSGIGHSLAIVNDTESGRIGAFVVGNRIRGAVVTDIEQTRVHLDNQGALEYLDLLAGRPERSPPDSPAVSRQSSDRMGAELDRGIKKLAPHRYHIERRTLDALLENVAALSRSARAVPEIRAGKLAGFRLFAVRPGGPVARIGLGNGDVITSLNGLELAGPDKAVEAFAKLRAASHLSLRFERGGSVVTNDYDIE